MKLLIGAMSIALALLLCAAPALADGEEDAARKVASLLGQMSCPGACTYVVAIIDSHPAERDALLAMDAEALPALSRTLLEDESRLRRDMAEVFLDELLSRRQGAEQTPADAEALDALLSHTGRAYEPHPPNPKWAP